MNQGEQEKEQERSVKKEEVERVSVKERRGENEVITQ